MHESGVIQSSEFIGAIAWLLQQDEEVTEEQVSGGVGVKGDSNAIDDLFGDRDTGDDFSYLWE